MKTTGEPEGTGRGAHASVPETGRSELGDVIEMVPRMLRLERILVPVDFSESSGKALRYAIAFAQQFDARITLLYVLQLPYYPADLTYLPTGEPTLEQATESAQKRVNSIASESVPPELAGDALVRVGSPFDQIAQAAGELHSDLIIISTHGFTGLKHVLMGSTAERVVRHAPCPVLVVREREHEFV